MSIRVKDIIQLDSFQQMKLIGGENGLDQSVNWVYIAECFDNPFDSFQWLYGGEIVFITGRGIKGDEALLIKLIQGFYGKNVSGLIINVGPYIERVSQEVIELVNQLGFPLFLLPWEIRIAEASREIYTAIAMSSVQEVSVANFFHELLFGTEPLQGNLVERAAYFGYNLSGDCCVYSIDIDDFNGYLKKYNLKSEVDIVKVKTRQKQMIQDGLVTNHIHACLIDKNDSLIFIHKQEENKERMLSVLREIQEQIANQISGMTVSVGIGDTYNNLNLMRDSLREAELCLKRIQLSHMKQEILQYQELGIYQLLFAISDTRILEKFSTKALIQIIEYDKLNNAKLVETLEVYLNENCNMTSTSEKLFLHRNTLRYRINKIEELLHVDLHNFNQCIKLKMALDAWRLVIDD